MIMISTRKSGLVVKTLSISLFGLALNACDGVEGDAPAAGDPAPAAVEESFEVTSMGPGPDGKPAIQKTRMTESQWQEIMERRRGAAPAKAPAADPSVFVTQQAATVFTSNCGDASTTLVYSGNFSGSRACLWGSWYDNGNPDQTADVGFAIHSYITGNSGQTLICTGTGNCNVYQSPCGNGSSVWLNAGMCTNPYGYGCSGTVSSTPPYYTARYVHVQYAYPFYCR
jgi:hypothetical protein